MRLCIQTSFSNFLPSKYLCVLAFMRSNFKIWLNPNRTATKNLCVHAFVRSNSFSNFLESKFLCVRAFIVQTSRYSSIQIELKQKPLCSCVPAFKLVSQIFCYQNIFALVRSCVQASRYGSIQIELKPKTSVFMRSNQFSNFLESKFLCIRAFMRSNLEIQLNPNRTETKNLCVHAVKLVT